MHYDPEYLLKRFTDHFKQKYKVECISALHHNKRKTNYHIHLIFAERQLLDKPVEKIATRNMFYDEMGKHRRTKKEILDEAGNIRKRCRVVRKGEMYERKLFTKKNELFKADGYLDEVKRVYTDLINTFAIKEEDKLHVFEKNGMYLATKKVGKNNPKAAEIEADNKVRIEHIDRELFVSQLQYTVSKSEQRDVMDAMMVRESNSFYEAKSSTTILKHSETSQIKYDLIGKIAEGTVLTRKTVAAILQGISPIKFAMFKNNPEEFITKVIRLIKEQKATMIVEHISYDQIEGKYDSSIFTAEKHASFDKAYRAKKHIQDYVFTDGTAEKSVERRFAEELDGAKEVCVYAKLPKGFAIPTPVGSYSPDWAIAFYEGTVKHIYFIAETKGTMESLELRPIEKAKISCARKLFNEISTENVVYHDVDSYQNLLNIMNSIEK